MLTGDTCSGSVTWAAQVTHTPFSRLDIITRQLPLIGHFSVMTTIVITVSPP